MIPTLVVGATLDVSRAVQRNAAYSKSLGWREFERPLATLVGLEAPFSPADFARKVAAFQQSHRLAVDGIVGPNTLAAIKKALAPPQVAIKRGERGVRVSNLQATLNFWNEASGGKRMNLVEDGIFGAKTEQRVKDFQKALRLSQDGYVGPATWQRLTSIASTSAGPNVSGYDVGQLVPAPHCLSPSVPHPGDLAIPGFLAAWNAVLGTNIAQAKHISIPPTYIARMFAYAAQSLIDGPILVSAFLRCPRFWSGGFVVKSAGSGVLALTMDKDIFANPSRLTGGTVACDTYVHELVHVFQYRAVGIAAFLASYFGQQALTIVLSWLSGKSIPPRLSSVHEMHAYGVEARFQAFLLARGVSLASCK